MLQSILYYNENVFLLQFSKPILKVIRDAEGKSTIIFKDGDCAALAYALYARKNLEPATIVDQAQTIIDVAIFALQDKNYIAYICKRDVDYCITTCELNTDINTPFLETMKKVEIQREELIGGKVVGVTISACAEPPQVHVLCE